MSCFWVGDYGDRPEKIQSFEEWYRWAYDEIEKAYKHGWLTRDERRCAHMDIEDHRMAHHFVE